MSVLTQQRHKYDCEVSEAIDKILRKIFGDNGTLVIYEYLEKRYSLRRDEIVEKIDVFAEGLKELLSSGACVIEKEILEGMRSSYGLTHGLEFERGRVEYDFVSQMKMLRVA